MAPRRLYDVSVAKNKNDFFRDGGTVICFEQLEQYEMCALFDICAKRNMVFHLYGTQEKEPIKEDEHE